MIDRIWSGAGPRRHQIASLMKKKIDRQRTCRLMVAHAKRGACLKAMVKYVCRGSNGKNHKEEDEETSLPVVGTDMLCGIQDSPHESPYITIQCVSRLTE